MAHTPKPIRKKGRRIFNHFLREDRNHPDYEPGKKISQKVKRINRYKRSAKGARMNEDWDESAHVKLHWHKGPSRPKMRLPWRLRPWRVTRKGARR